MVQAAMATMEGDWEVATSILKPIAQPDYLGFPLIVPGFAQLHMWTYVCATGMINLFEKELEKEGEDAGHKK